MSSTGYFDLPLSLLISVKDKSEYDYTTRNILNFYNLYDSTIVEPEQFPHQIIEKESNKSIIKHLNFIRLNTNYTSTTTINDRVQERLSVSDDTIIPSFSCILITNNSIIATSGKQNNLTQLNRNDWVYNHKVDLNDQNGTPIARQLFFKLTNNLPLLFSRSNWTPPHNLNTLISESVDHTTIANTPCKYIVRLNINCINYDSMLYFYRLLFSKCSNYSKKNFSLFVLKTSRLDNTNVAKSTQITVEYQLSLKYDHNAFVQTSKNTALIYQVNDYELFIKIVRVLEKYSHELITKKVFSVQDPDRNKIFLVDTSVRFAMPIFSIANSIGLSENYFRILQSIQKNARLNVTSSSPSSSSSSSSFSCSPNSIGTDMHTSSNITTTQIVSNSAPFLNKNNSAKFIKSKKKIKNDQRLLKESSREQLKRSCSSSSSSHPMPLANQIGGVRDLINRFSRRFTDMSGDRHKKASQLEVRNYSRSKSQNDSCTNLDKIPKSPALDNSILQDQTNLEILNIEKLRRKQQACLLEASHMLRQRSQSAMNEPYSNTNNQQANNKNPAFNTSSFSSSPNSSVSSISMFQKPNTKHHITVLDSCSTLSRNKSVSANNINESHNNVINYNGNEDNFMPKLNELRPRSKSTVPFNELKTENSLETSCYLVADVDQASYEYVQSGTYNFNQVAKPSVGITPSTRFRRAPTLDMIRSTKMPVQHPPYLTALNKQIGLNSPAFIRRPNYCNEFGNSTYLTNVDLRNDVQVAKF